MSFHSRDGDAYCEDVRIEDIRAGVAESPFYLYSCAQITANYRAYADTMRDTPCIVAYAVKANGNLAILKQLVKLGAGAVLVSGGELRLAMAAGFDPALTIFNGTGKTLAEILLAARYGVVITIDSEFDLQHIEQAATQVGRSLEVLVRVNPDIDPEVHPYVATGIRSSKFGIDEERASWCLDRVAESRHLHLAGLHCHLGSTIDNVDIFRDAARFMVQLIERSCDTGAAPKYLNIGGGLGIDYEKSHGLPGPGELIGAVRDLIPSDMTLIVEPGRSIVGNAGALVCRVIGVKRNGDKRFIVVDGSMAELIRPSLYGAYHHIEFTQPVGGDAQTFDIVGPICESGDFLGKDRVLATPEEGAGLIVHDAGAYGYSMSSNYNARMRPPEYLVDGNEWRMIRRGERFEDSMRLFDDELSSGG